MRLLPKNRGHGWAPFTWLLYFVFFLLDPFLSHVGWKAWLADGLGTIAFLVLYFSFFWLKYPTTLLNVAGMVLLGVGFSPFNGGACTFFVFAAAFIPFAVEKESTALKLLAVVLAVATLDWWLLHLSGWFLFYGGGLSMVVGGGNIYFAERNRANMRLRKANEEIEHLAKVAERERIARDLHDVLGHTLSVIILKSELAGKLMDRDPARARAEISDVEQTSRKALAEVRSTIRGYRVHSLEAELKQARAALETAGVTVESEAAELNLTPAQESVVALVIREAVTNVVRHAGAHHCQLRLAPVNGGCRLEIHDDGRGGFHNEGNGLRGMRERIEALGGTLVHETSAGTRLTIQFPLTQTNLTKAQENGNL
jgi:two-component system sensor histidine kinase DesK